MEHLTWDLPEKFSPGDRTRLVQKFRLLGVQTAFSSLIYSIKNCRRHNTRNIKTYQLMTDNKIASSLFA